MTFFHFDNILITLSNITCHHLWCSSSFLSHIIAYLALSLLHLEWWFFFPCITAWRATISYPLCHPMHSNPKISIREVVLSMMIHVTLVYESLHLSGYVFLLEMVLYWLKHAKKKKNEKTKKQKNKNKKRKEHIICMFIILFSFEHMHRCGDLFYLVYMLERLCMRALWDLNFLLRFISWYSYF